MPRRRRNKVQRLVIAVKKFVAFLISHVGLCALVVAYTMLGAVIFQAVEGPSDLETQQNQKDNRMKAVEIMWQATYDHNILEPKKWEQKVWEAVNEYKDILLRTIRKGYDAKDTQWTFSGAFLYSLTVITTIGYGNITCRTYFGKALTIAYAIIGIPLMLLFLTNIGDILAKVSKFLYRRAVKLKLLTVLWHRRRRQQAAIAATANKASGKKSSTSAGPVRHKKSTAASASPRQPKGSSLHSGSAKSRQGAKQSTAFPFPEQPQQQPQQVQLQLSKSHIRYKTSNCSQDSFLLTPGQQQQKTLAASPTSAPPVVAEPLTAFEEMNIDVLSHQFELEELSIRESFEEKMNKMNVPLWLVLLTMLLYLIGGAVLFVLWEPWDFLEAFYFCYISLATIGFGDLFPGASLADDKSAQEKLVITSMYLLFGMALIAMCFNLAQEEVVNKVTRLAVKLGIVKSDSYDNS